MQKFKERTVLSPNFGPGLVHDYTMWKITRRYKRPFVKIPLLKDEQKQ